MQPLLIIRSERGQMSAIERRIADFILDNAHLLRDYSSQQLANALGISQSSVVKFSQKLGFKGYPDLKYSIGEAIARNGDVDVPAATDADDHRQAALARGLWQAKSRAEEETRLLNPPEQVEAVAAMLRDAGKVFVVGIGEDSVMARAFAIRLSLLGFLAIHHFDPVLVPAEVSTAKPGDVLMLFSERGQPATLCQLARLFRARFVVEMRDAWPDLIRPAGVVAAGPGQRLRAAVVAVAHRAIIRLQTRSDLVVTTTETFAEVVEARGAARVGVVRNGTAFTWSVRSTGRASRISRRTASPGAVVRVSRKIACRSALRTTS